MPLKGSGATYRREFGLLCITSNPSGMWLESRSAFTTFHLYNAIYRFDDEMIVTPYLYRAHGYQHPALHLRRLSAYGAFAAFADQYDMIWSEAVAKAGRSLMAVEGA